MRNINGNYWVMENASCYGCELHLTWTQLMYKIQLSPFTTTERSDDKDFVGEKPRKRQASL